jgi:hypothetical protein
MSTSADNLDLLSSDKLASAIANSGEKIASVIAAADEFQREAARLQSRTIHPFFPAVAPAPPLRRRRSWFAVMGAIVMLMVAIVVGVVAVGQWSFPALWQQWGDRYRAVEFGSSGVLRVAAPRLLAQASRASSGEPAPLSLTLQGEAKDAVVMITGLAPGMTLSTGSQIGVDSWQVPAAALPSTWIGPPTNFAGVVDLVAELHLADMTIADRRKIKLEWGAAIPAAAAGTAVAPPPEQNVAPYRHLGADEPTVETDRAALHLTDMMIAERRPIKLEWGGVILAAAAASTKVETEGTTVAPPREHTAAPPLQLGADDPTVEMDRTAVAPPREQTAVPPLQLGIDEPTVEADRTDRTAVAPAAASPKVETDRTAVAAPREQNVAPSRQLGIDDPTVETDRTAVEPPREQTAAPPLRLGIDDPTVETDRTAVAAPLRQPGANDPMVETGRTAVAPPQEQTAAAPPLQLGIDEPTVEADRTDRTAVALAAASPKVETNRTAVAPPREQNVAPSRQLDVDEIAALLKHGENLIRNGDLAAARLVLQRAAEAKSAEAALTLAATYDPVILRELRVYGFASDVGMARSWYEKAKEFGSAAAPQRLEILTSAAR